jgi:polar amino acid transport system permease protein
MSPEAPHRTANFGVKVWLTWVALLGLLVWLFVSLHLDFGYAKQKLPYLLGVRLTPDGFIQGAALTLFVTACSMICALLVALLTALGRMSSNPIGFGIATFYASLFRGTPLLVQVLIFYLALPQVGIVLGALGLQRWLIVWKITGPQALRLIIPPAGALFISMLKDSSLVSILGLWELNFLAQSYARASYHYMEMLICAAVIYWMLSIVFEVVQHRLELRFGRGVESSGR